MSFPVNLRSEGGSLKYNPTAWSNSDRNLYGSRFNILLNEMREPDITTGIPLRPYKADSNSWHVPVFGAIFTVPYALPGSENKDVAAGTTVNTRGGLICQSYGSGTIVEFGLRSGTIDNSGQFVSAGPWASAKSVHDGTAGAFTWVTADDTGVDNITGYLPFPVGFTTGTTYQMFVAFRASGSHTGANHGYLGGFQIFEPKLINANPR